MANQGEMLPNHQHQVDANVQAGHAARVLMLLGAAAVVSTVYNCNADADADASQVFIAIIGFLAWLLGVCLLWLVLPFRWN
jgi:hypothetical protein